ncbi:SGNH/GDSL hydrolase family protein [Streptomyces sp. CB01881]|uniref:SGNH/GDSL hydrolase family protein n=1 Tax=Streptomyces sp. CB01881 TaxID=2078691 RepID=UPI000CDBE1EA|nr:SGNH/GDSL hydrolase family protein [Streptomyces sp. CB01881]AUY48223.1 G-D-S-L family lipolytic protein [Streptomyces sp. CB01881]TYC76714.1 SGNH/GDSL hydrolase family protein [Streptomyces sp. CB01881]
MIPLPRAAAIAALTALSIAATPTPASAGSAHRQHWSAAWAAPMMHPSAAPWFATWAGQGFDHQTVREVVRLGTGGKAVRFRLSNAYGTAPLRLTGASVGRAADGAAVVPGTVRPLHFDHGDSVVVPAGGEVLSDPVPLPVAARDRVALTLYFDGPTGPATYHQLSMTTTYRADGDHRGDTGAAAFSDAVRPGYGSWYYVSGVEVTGGRRVGKAVVAFGESTTDGFGATVDGDDRYPDRLAERLVADGRPRPVLNAGIGSNKMLADSACAGDSALSRFERDVLDQPDVGTVIVSHGMNDILRTGDQICGVDRDDPPVTLQRLIDAHRTLIRAAHARGVKAVGATLMPFGGAPFWTPQTDRLRRDLNEWIRTSGEYDAVADFDLAIDPAGTGTIPDGYHSGDHLHPSPLGYRAMADGIDLDSLQ